MTLLIDYLRASYPPRPRRLSTDAEAFGIGEGLLPWSTGRIVGASASIHGTIGGLAHRSAATASGIVRRAIPAMGNVGGQFIGLLTTFRTTTTTANAVVGALGSESGSSGNTLFNLYLTGTNNADITFVYGGSSTSLTLAATGVSLNDGNVHTVLAVAGPFSSAAENLTAAIYVDGRRVATGTAVQALGISNAYTSVLAGGWRRGGADSVYTTQGDVDTLAVFPILRYSLLNEAEGRALTRAPYSLFEPRRIWVPVASAATHDATGALTAQAATVAGSANHVTTHASSGVLEAQAATVAGSATHVAVHGSTGVLEAQAATVSGSADHSAAGAFSATGALTAQVATVAGSAAHLTLHTATGALASGSATAAGAAVHYTLHTAAGDLVADAASIAGSALHEGDGAEVAKPFTGAGRPRRTRQRVVVEIDGEDFIAESSEEAQAILDQAKEAAEEKAKVAIERATKARNRPTRKVMADARKALELPAISAPDLGGYAEEISRQIEDIYQSAIQTIEVAALLRKRELEEEDDEDILLLIA